MNENVRVVRGERDTIVVMSAYCPTCKQDAMPQTNGTCSFCGTPIVDEDTLNVREMLAQLDAPAPQPPRTGGRQREWTDEKAIAAIRKVGEPLGRAPTRREMRAAGFGGLQAVGYLSPWSELITRAGFTPRPHGGRTPTWTRERALELLRQQATDGVAPSRVEFMAAARISNAALVRLFGTYTQMVATAGLRPKLSERYEDWSPEKSDPDAPSSLEQTVGRSIVGALRAAADALEQELGLLSDDE